MKNTARNSPVSNYEKIIDIPMRDGRIQPVYVRLEADTETRFRFTLDYDQWIDIPPDESLAEAVHREFAAMCARIWPDHPEYWPV